MNGFMPRINRYKTFRAVSSWSVVYTSSAAPMAAPSVLKDNTMESMAGTTGGVTCAFVQGSRSRGGWHISKDSFPDSAFFVVDVYKRQTQRWISISLQSL